MKRRSGPDDSLSVPAPSPKLKPTSFRYVFTCGDGPCQLSYEYENGPQPPRLSALKPKAEIIPPKLPEKR